MYMIPLEYYRILSLTWHEHNITDTTIYLQSAYFMMYVPTYFKAYLSSTFLITFDTIIVNRGREARPSTKQLYTIFINKFQL